jgi:signal transduction histidine kinase/CheY-like chemotaxis protein
MAELAAPLQSALDDPVPLDSVLITSELERRRARMPDYEAESRVLGELMDAMASAPGPGAVLQHLVENALALCRAHSAGLSLLETEQGREVFRWRATAGAWSRCLRASLPRELSPSEAVLERDAPLLMANPERRYRCADGMPPLAEVLLLPFHSEGKPAGALWVVAHDETRHFDAEDRRLLTRLSRFAASAYQLLCAQETRARDERLVALRDTQDRLQTELDDARLLGAISAELIVQDNEKALYEKLLDAAIVVMRSDFASIQRYVLDGEGGTLLLIAERGFSPEATKFWESVVVDSNSVCGQALRKGRRVITPDVRSCPSIEGTEDLAVYDRTGIRAVQSTPLLSRSGQLVGMISTHWGRVHEPSDRDLCLFDILARQAADLIERKQAEDALREADRRKDDFLATVAHELRNPLAPVRNAAQVLKLCDPAGPELGRAREMIDRQVGQMSRLIEDLLDISRITRDKLELRKERVRLASVVRAAVESSRGVVDEGGHVLTVSMPSDPIVVDADPARLAQVFSNLLINAAKYSEPNRHIDLTVRREGSDVAVSVRDHGIGIAGDMLARVFELFTQVESSPERGRGGFGIGLTLVKRLVELHGGSVSASSGGIGEGSDFVVRLPIVDASADRKTKVDAAPAKAPGPCRVLVVDDNEDGAGSMAALLELLGYETRTAYDGLDGFEVAQDFRPDVAILDLGMPGISGDELARRIRKEPWGRKMILLAVTGWGQPKDRQRTAEAGFDDHLVKPVEPTRLARLIASLAATPRSRD